MIQANIVSQPRRDRQAAVNKWPNLLKCSARVAGDVLDVLIAII